MEKEVVDKIRYYIDKKKSIDVICKELNLEKYQVYGVVELLKQSGLSYDVINGEIIKLNTLKQDSGGLIELPIKNDSFKFMAISDIHYASKWDNPQLVEYAYDKAQKEEVAFVTNSGDIVEGNFMAKRPEHIYQVNAFGIEQLDYTVDKYPKSNIPTYFITGNHDFTFIKTCGANIGKMLNERRPDLTYLGHDIADIKIGKTIIRLRHGVGSGSYAKSYKLQKYCETLPVNDLPHIILQGHYHYSAYFRNRDIHCINVPSLQSYTDYAKSLGLPSEVGFWIIEVGTDKNGNIIQITPTLYSFEEKSYKKTYKRK